MTYSWVMRLVMHLFISDGYHDAVCEKGATYKGYLNVLEDIRIEKHIKNKYAGLRRIFYDAYKELHVDLISLGSKTMM